MTTSCPFWTDPLPLVLASGSVTRRQLLEQAGLPLVVDPAQINERQVEAGLPPSERRAEAVARNLAVAKAIEVSARHPGHLVIGADQTLDHDGEILHKPQTLAEARRQIERLSASAHHLHSAFALVRDGRLLASGVASAILVMRELPGPTLEAYLAATGHDCLQSVGGYQLEKHGVHLFHAINGDHFTILGLPMLDVLAVLRQIGAAL